MSPFSYQVRQLHCETTPLAAVAAAVGTPVYVYSRADLLARADAYKTAVPSPTLICYAVKANGNPTLLRLLARTGLGADVTSGGELYLAQQTGVPPERIIFSGVGKTQPEIEQALAANIYALHVESEMELGLIGTVAARRRQVARLGIRVNPDIGADTHPHIRTGTTAHKFGVPLDRALALMRAIADHPWLTPGGLAAHIGSQITDLPPFITAAQFLVAAARRLESAGIRLAYLDVGGGLGIGYKDGETAPPIPEWLTAVSTPITAAGYRFVCEPGRSIVGPVGVLLTQVLYTKQQGGKTFVIVDAGMNDLLRPTLYGARHPILPVKQPASQSRKTAVDVVGPVCETGDFLARERLMPPLRPGDLLAVMAAGAYGFAMSSNYNGRLRPAEVLVNSDNFRIIRRRQTQAHLLADCPADAAT